MEEKRGKRSKYSRKQKEVIRAALSSTAVNDHNLPPEEVFQIPLGKALLRENGFEPLYTHLSRGGESYHMLANNGLPYFFFLCQPDDATILPGCETDVEVKWLSDDLMEIRFVFSQKDGARYLGIPFVFLLRNDQVGGMIHRWELRQLLNLIAFEILLIASSEDQMIRYVGSAPVRFNEHKKEAIYDSLSRYLSLEKPGASN